MGHRVDHIRRITIAAFAVLLFCAFAISAVAHSGGTDSNGGHTNHSTGEYHYHHGYSAHQHYDMDDDGVLDCPYDFKDKTGGNIGSNSSSTHKTNNKENNSDLISKIIITFILCPIVFLFLAAPVSALLMNIVLPFFHIDNENIHMVCSIIIAIPMTGLLIYWLYKL